VIGKKGTESRTRPLGVGLRVAREEAEATIQIGHQIAAARRPPALAVGRMSTYLDETQANGPKSKAESSAPRNSALLGATGSDERWTSKTTGRKAGAVW